MRKEGAGSGLVQSCRASFVCSWAAQSRLKRPPAGGASSTSIRDSGHDLATAGSVVVLFFSFPLATACCRSSSGLFDHNWLHFLVASALALVLPSADPGPESSYLAQVLLARDQAWLDPFQEPPGPYPEWPCPVPFGPFSTLSSCCRDPDMTLPFVASGTSTVVYLQTESLLLLAVWSERETLPNDIPCCCSSQGFSQGHALSGLHPPSIINTASVADSLHSPCASSCRMASNFTANLSSTCV